MTLTLPTIHLNGSARDRLLEDTLTAVDALRRAIECLQDAAPNAHDYYATAPGAFWLASCQHTDRVRRLQGVLAELQAIADHVAGQ